MVKPITYRKISVAAIEKDVAAIFLPVAQRIGGLLLGAATPDDGTIQLSRERRDVLLSQIDELVLGLFVDPQTRAAFDRDGVTALRPYGQLLNQWYVKVVYEAVKVHHTWMRRSVPEDVQRWLSRKPGRSLWVGELVNPFLRRDDESVEAYKERLKPLRLFDPNPLAEYDPLHRWVDPNGYVLSERIWKTADNTRDQIHRLVADAIRTGMSARDLAKQLEQFLVPGRAELRTKKPYGSDASRDAMRLARTEIARAANWAAYRAALANPYIDQLDVARSATGDPTCSVCRQHATIGIDGERVRPAYPLRDARLPIYHPHCKCALRSVISQAKDAITAQLRAVMQDAQQELLVPYLTPLSLESFLLDLVGRQMMNLMAQVVQLPLPL